MLYPEIFALYRFLSSCAWNLTFLFFISSFQSIIPSAFSMYLHLHWWHRRQCCCIYVHQSCHPPTSSLFISFLPSQHAIHPNWSYNRNESHIPCIAIQMNFGKLKITRQVNWMEAAIVKNETDNFYRKINGDKKQWASKIELCRYVCWHTKNNEMPSNYSLMRENIYRISHSTKSVIRSGFLLIVCLSSTYKCSCVYLLESSMEHYETARITDL